MIKRIGLVLVCGLVFGDCYSQNPLVKQWDKDFGGTDDDLLNSFQQTTDGGYILGGWSRSGIGGDKTQTTWGFDDYWIIKIDSLENKQWDKDFGGTDDDVLNSIKQTADGGYIFGGFSWSGSNGDKTQASWGYEDFWIVKTDSLGNKQWDKDFGGMSNDELFSLQQTADGGYIFGGYSHSGITGNKTTPNWDNSGITADYWIIKTDSLGNKQWEKDFGGTDDDELHSLQQTADGGYILGGWSSSGISGDKSQATWGYRDYWIVKTDSMGNKLWDKNFGGNSEDRFYSLMQTTDGGYILGGWSGSTISGDKTQTTWGDVDYWIIKIDSIGNKQWDKDFGGFDDDEFTEVKQTTDAGYLLAGTSYSPISGDKTEDNLGPEQTWIVKTDSLGNKQWDKTLHTNVNVDDEIGLAIQANDGCFVMANYTLGGIGGDKSQPSWGFRDYWIIKFCDTTLTTSITPLPNNQLPFSISPNPTTGTIQLTFNTKHNGAVQCEIWNVMGERVYASPAPLTPKGEPTRTQLDVSFLAKGIYVVRVGDGERWENRKLVIE